MNAPSWKPAFLTVVVGQAVSVIGSSAVQFALIWWLASETGSPLMMSLAGLAAFLPQLLIGPFAGVWIDRLPRKTVIICADLFIGLVAVLWAASFLFWQPPYWSACLVLGLRAVGGVFHTPAFQAAIPMLVPSNELVRANGWNQLLTSGAYLVGPALGAILYTFLPISVILLSDLVGAVVASVAVALVSFPEIRDLKNRDEKPATPNFLAEFRQGVAVFVRNRTLGFVTLTLFLCMILFSPISLYYPLMTSDYFKVDALHMSVNQISYTIGMMGGAVAFSFFGSVRNKLAAAYLGIIVMGLIVFLCGLLPPTAPGFWIFVALCLVLGMSVNLYNIPFTAYMQQTVPPEALGRAFSLLGSSMSVALCLGLALAWPFAGRFGVPILFVVAGIGITIIATLSAAVVLRKKEHP